MFISGLVSLAKDWWNLTSASRSPSCHLLLQGHSQRPVLGANYRGGVPALWGEGRLREPGPEVRECRAEAEGPLRGRKDRGTCRKAENPQQKQVAKEKELLLVAGPFLLNELTSIIKGLIWENLNLVNYPCGFTFNNKHGLYILKASENTLSNCFFNSVPQTWLH